SQYDPAGRRSSRWFTRSRYATACSRSIRGRAALTGPPAREPTAVPPSRTDLVVLGSASPRTRRSAANVTVQSVAFDANSRVCGSPSDHDRGERRHRWAGLPRASPFPELVEGPSLPPPLHRSKGPSRPPTPELAAPARDRVSKEEVWRITAR